MGFEISFVAWFGLLILEFKSLMRGEVCTLGHFVLRWHHWAGIWRRLLLVFWSLQVFIILCLFSRCIVDVVSSINFISCPSLSTWSENLDSPSYLKSFLCSLNYVLKFVCSLYIKFVAAGACLFINSLAIIFVGVFFFVWDYVIQFFIVL